MNSIQKGDLARRLYRGEGSVRLEEEIILPDYCADVTRLVRTEAQPTFDKHRAYIQDGVLNVEVSGRVELRLIYTDGEEVESYRSTHPFAYTFKKDIGKGTRVIPDSLSVFLTPISSHSSPRVLSPRKLLARCEMNLLCEVFANIEYVTYDPCDDLSSARVDVEREERSIARTVASRRRELSLVQEVKLPSSLPSCAKVLSCSAVISVDSTHPSTDSMACYMTVSFNVLYLSEENGERGGEIVSFYQPVEVRETVECDDCAEDSVCRVRAVAGMGEAKILTDSFGENRVLSLELPYILYTSVLENVDTDFLIDAYGVGCSAECEHETEEFIRYLGSLSESTPFRERLILKSDASEVGGVIANAYLRGVSTSDGETVADVTLELEAMTLDGGIPSGSLADSLDIRVPLNIPDSMRQRISSEGLWCDAVVLPSFVDASVSQGALEVSGELICQAQVWDSFPIEYVSGVSFSDREPLSDKTVFYYPSEEDTLWTVGKRYGVSREAICKANGIEDGALPRVVEVAFD